MCRLFETIKIYDGRAEHVSFHNARMNDARKNLFGCGDAIDLRDFITIPQEHAIGRHKCKVVYSRQIHEVLFELYPARSIRNLKVLHCDDIEYSYKFCDRERINALFRMREGRDEILIVKHGLVTDTSISNIAFFDGSRWLTPRSVLLRGTKRDQLLSQGKILESDIGISDLGDFKKAGLINAMLDLGEITIEIADIY